MEIYDKMINEYNKRNSNFEEKNTLFIPIVAIVFIVIGIYLLNSFNSFAKNAKETTAIIHSERIIGTTNGSLKNDSENKAYRMYAEYKLGKKVYNEYIGDFSTSGIRIGFLSFIDTKEGDEITIYYNPSNPSEFKVKDNNLLFAYMFIGLGSIAFCVSICKFITKGIK